MSQQVNLQQIPVPPELYNNQYWFILITNERVPKQVTIKLSDLAYASLSGKFPDTLDLAVTALAYDGLLKGIKELRLIDQDVRDISEEFLEKGIIAVKKTSDAIFEVEKKSL